jgi:hypothetical protein
MILNSLYSFQKVSNHNAHKYNGHIWVRARTPYFGFLSIKKQLKLYDQSRAFTI